MWQSGVTHSVSQSVSKSVPAMLLPVKVTWVSQQKQKIKKKTIYMYKKKKSNKNYLREIHEIRKWRKKQEPKITKLYATNTLTLTLECVLHSSWCVVVCVVFVIFFLFFCIDNSTNSKRQSNAKKKDTKIQIVYVTEL